MLEHVTAHQTRFVTPGLGADTRGIALGRYCVVLLPSIDRVVGLFRGISERGSLDDLLPSLTILQVKTPLKSREFIVQVPVTNSHVADGVSAAATLMGGLTFTGSAKHFVKYRDSRSPLGYDTDNLHTGKGDLILYATDFVQAYQRDREVPFNRLALNLSVEPDRQQVVMPDETLLLRVAPGLWRVVTSYLHRNNLPCEVAACEREAGPGQSTERFYLIRGVLEPRMVELFRRTPGIEVHLLKSDRVAVQLGYRHPLELSSCSSIFDKDRFYLFSGQRDLLELITGGVRFFSAAALVQLGDAGEPIRHESASGTRVDGFNIPLKLVVAQGGARPPVRAARIALDHADWLKKLVYLLPPHVLAGYRVCLTEESIFLFNEGEAEFVPLGTLFYQVALGVMVPVGFELVPRVHPEVLVQHLESGRDKLYFFCTDSPIPIQLPLPAFEPLTRQVLAHLQVRPLAPVARERPTTREAQLVNDPVGLFPLWGFSAKADPESEGG